MVAAGALVVCWACICRYLEVYRVPDFQLTVSVAVVVINVVAAKSSGDVPLNIAQLFWVNLIMDTLGALALATEPPTDHLMHRTPVGRLLQLGFNNLAIFSCFPFFLELEFDAHDREPCLPANKASVEQNAWELKQYIEVLYLGSVKGIMLFGHSKGGVVATAA
ncbi:hypothetical protein RJ639_040517 [Escallonia herrerae]|uniref:Cation-transporting P-type ATPase C-terminal domain-containing protein n=1 Tax=Escallonia herrerae TaxID=1293975 RepID=A0AA88WEL7_9ASTE|nr:hypothetical protein RJ639_040517 [Escallonia herrerae]